VIDLLFSCSPFSAFLALHDFNEFNVFNDLNDLTTHSAALRMYLLKMILS